MDYFVNIEVSNIEDHKSKVILNELFRSELNMLELNKSISDIVMKYKGDWFNLTIAHNNIYGDVKIVLIDNGMKYDINKLVHAIKILGKPIEMATEPDFDDYYPIIFFGEEYNILDEETFTKIKTNTSFELKEKSHINIDSESGAGSVFTTILYGVLGNATFELIKQGIKKAIGNTNNFLVSRIPYSYIVKESERISGVPRRLHILVSMKYENSVWIYEFRAKGKNIFIKMDDKKNLLDYSIT
jgi:hypothetical protein